MKALAIALVLFLPACPAAPVSSMPPSRVPNALDATVALTNAEGRSYCAGVFVGQYVLTAAHCISDGEGTAVDVVHIRLRDGAGLSDTDLLFTVAAFDDLKDYAVLAPKEVLPSHASAILSPTDVIPGDRVVIIGHPLGLTHTITEGVTSGVRPFAGDGTVWLQVSAQVSPGNSGGPVFNEFGEVIGIVSFRVVGRNGPESHLAFAVPLSVLRVALER